VISPVIGHLVENGVDVHLIDNRSTDATVAEASRWLGKGLLAIEEFPREAPPSGSPPPFDWTAILQRKEELARELDADWFLHHDADEIREAPWPGMTLGEAMRWVDRLGYNSIGFRVFNFPPIDDGYEPGSDLRAHFSYWKEAPEFDRSQIKCWKAGRPVSLVPSGGHEAAFPNRNVFPIPFLMRHYPIRSSEQGRRKVFEERKGRFVERERARDWHIQYDAMSDPGQMLLADPAELRQFDADQARLELMLANEVTRWEQYRARELQESLEAANARLADAEARLGEESRRASELEREASALKESHRETAAAVARLEERIEALTDRLAAEAKRSGG
jgi:hypothetical protein